MRTKEPDTYFMELYNPVSRQISNYCRSLTGADDTARDLLQDTLLAAYEGFDSLKKKESFLFYLCAIARRTYLKQVRRSKFWGDNSKIDANTHFSPETDGNTGADIQILNNALGKLPDEQREALVLFEIIGFSIEEIRDIQGGSLSGVKTRLVRARQKLALILSDKETGKQEVKTTKNRII